MPHCGVRFSLLSTALSVTRLNSATARWLFDSDVVGGTAGQFTGFTINGSNPTAVATVAGNTRALDLTYGFVGVGLSWSMPAGNIPPGTANNFGAANGLVV